MLNVLTRLTFFAGLTLSPFQQAHSKLLSSSSLSCENSLNSIEVFDQPLIQDTIITSREILMDCPPGCLVVGLGRSPSPIIAAIQSQRPDKAINLPLMSKTLENYVPRELPSHPLLFTLTAQQKSKLFDYFERMIGPYLTSGTKEIKLVDFVVTGRGLFATHIFLQEFLISKNYPITVSSFALTSGQFEAMYRKYLQIYPVNAEFYFMDRHSPLLRDLMMSKFDVWSQYSSFNLWTDEGFQTNSRYNDLVDHFRKALTRN